MPTFFRDFWWRWRFLYFGKVWKRSDQSSRKYQKWTNSRSRVNLKFFFLTLSSDSKWTIKITLRKKISSSNAFLWSFWRFNNLRHLMKFNPLGKAGYNGNYFFRNLESILHRNKERNLREQVGAIVANFIGKFRLLTLIISKFD